MNASRLRTYLLSAMLVSLSSVFIPFFATPLELELQHRIPGAYRDVLG